MDGCSATNLSLSRWNFTLGAKLSIWGLREGSFSVRPHQYRERPDAHWNTYRIERPGRIFRATSRSKRGWTEAWLRYFCNTSPTASVTKPARPWMPTTGSPEPPISVGGLPVGLPSHGL